MEPCLVSASAPSAVSFEHQSQDKAWDLGLLFKLPRMGFSSSPALTLTTRVPRLLTLLNDCCSLSLSLNCGLFFLRETLAHPSQ